MNLLPQRFVAALSFAACASAHAGLLGSQVTMNYLYTDFIISQAFTVVSTAEVTCTGNGAGNATICGLLATPGSTQVIDIRDNGFTYALTGAAEVFEQEFEVLSFHNLDAFGPIGAALITSNIPGMSAARLSFSTYGVSINMSGLTVSNQQGFNIVLQGVPEPQTWALVVAGLMGAGAAARRRA